MNIISTIKQHKMMTIMSIVALLLLVVIIFSYSKQVSPISWGWYGQVVETNRYAINGYDSVNYHKNKSALRGDENYAYMWKGAHWLFNSEENKTLFVASPDNYVPQFGGFCAFAMSKGFTAASDSNAWHINDNKLYLFADVAIKKDWLTQLDGGIDRKGQKNWLTH